MTEEQQAINDAFLAHCAADQFATEAGRAEHLVGLGFEADTVARFLELYSQYGPGWWEHA